MPAPSSPSLSPVVTSAAVTAGPRGLDTPALAHLGIEVDAAHDRLFVTHAALQRALAAVLPRRGGLVLRALAADDAGAWVARLALGSQALTVALAPVRLTWRDGALCVVAGTPAALDAHARRAAIQLLVALARLFGGTASWAWAGRGGLPPGLRRDGEWMEWTTRVHDHAGLPAWVAASTPTALGVAITPAGTWFTLAPGGAPETTLGAVLAFVEEWLAPHLAGRPERELDAR